MTKTVSIVTGNLYTHDGATVVLGGLERYTRDLAFLCRDIGFDVTIHQFGNDFWEKDYEGFPVKAYPFNEGAEKCVEKYMAPDLEKSDYVLYMWLGFQTVYRPNSITINHGIWFDAPGGDGNWGVNVAKSHVKTAIDQVAALVTVDLNFVNFCRSVIPYADNNKMQYIPNYVDLNQFNPTNKEDDGMIEILYPRRYDRYRGIYLMKEIVPEILDQFPNVRFNFAIDENHPQHKVEWENWLNKQPHKDRIKYAHYPMDEMPKAYHDADIVVIPTICSEGTSLSALEAMACEKPIVVTNIGGLSNLVLPDFNGKIVNPTNNDIKDAISEYVNSPEDRLKHAKNAGYVARESFSKKRWDEQWKEIILTHWEV